MDIPRAVLNRPNGTKLTPMHFSVIIPTCHRNDLLAKCLDCLAPGQQSGLQIAEEKRNVETHVPKSGHGILAEDIPNLWHYSYEVIVSDDGTQSTAEQMIREIYPWARWAAGPRRGPAANRNNGAKHAKGEWLVFTDDDCLPQTGWLEAFALHSEKYDLLEGRTSALGLPARGDDECPFNESGGYLWSCNFAIKREKFASLKGFDEAFPSPAMEDVELNTRVNKASLARLFVPTAQVLHPWRRRKGRDFAKAYAKSVAHYVKLHPEQAPKFALRSVSITFLRTFKNRAVHAIKTGQFAGLTRQIYLDACSGFLSWREVARSS